MENMDALFEQYAEQQEKESRASQSKGNFQRTYEDIAWTGLETNVPKIVRVVGGPPNRGVSNYSAKTCTIAWVTGDDGKRFKLIRPSFAEDPNYIINRIISKINTTKWVNNQKTFPIKETHPELFNLIEKNGLTEGDKRYVFERGWKGKEVLIMNVIDREKMDWHRANKHTMLLAKSVTELNGNEFVDEGISAYSMEQKLAHLFSAYGSWEKYDLAIKKTGSKDNPYIIVNASHSPMEVDKAYQRYISSDAYLTEEEKSWEKYDIAKFYKPTSVIKIYNRLKNTIKRIDYALGTDFLKDLEREVEVEKKRLEAENAGKEEVVEKVEEVVEEVKVVESTPAPAARTRATRPAVAEPVVQYPPFFDTLDDSIKARVVSVSCEGDKWDITWNCPVEELAACPTCGVASPLEGVYKCPVCGEEF